MSNLFNTPGIGDPTPNNSGWSSLNAPEQKSKAKIKIAKQDSKREGRSLNSKSTNGIEQL